MSIETRQLRYFVAVAEEHHFGRAAQRLLIAQPPLSQQIRVLERSLGTELLTRTTRKVELKPAGELLLERGRRILAELDALEDEVKKVGDGLQGSLRIGFTGSTTYGLMPRVVREASRAFDGVALAVSGEMLTPQLVRELEDQHLDVVVLRAPVPPAEISHVTVAREQIVAAIPSNSRLADRATLTFDDFADQVMVGYPEDSSMSQAITARLLDHGLTPRYAHRVRETSALLSLVAAGIGPALVPQSATSLNLGGTVFREIEDAPTTELAVAWRTNDSSRLVERFVTFLTEVIRDVRGEVNR
ncbi:MAG: LysR family transcriptional regulator [Tistrella sp.]|uniref:LysR family transcriptional regulator n=1 Tax=Microbacteriaceae TaxID=85023 RepID=UPI000C4B8C5E|nr:LysR family transcriptional regulator [Microcella indica]MBA74064.1 LysR family transcriptional regulator [Tistrella sp.]MBA74124.1 LysR family transcriptional regulator [Tistrella sp.]